MINPILAIKDLKVSVGNHEILKGVDLNLEKGKIHMLMGPNGSGKSTLAFTLAGNPGYEVSGGEISFLGRDLLGLGAYERARAGIFVSYQDPPGVTGVSLTKMFSAYESVDLDQLALAAERIGINWDVFKDRSVNLDFSGGEKKKSEVLQMLALKPTLAVLDELDSGLDVDSLSQLASEIVNLNKDYNMTILAITHYTRLAKVLLPESVFVMVNGRIQLNGDISLAHEIEKSGYEPLIKDTIRG